MLELLAHRNYLYTCPHQRGDSVQCPYNRFWWLGIRLPLLYMVGLWGAGCMLLFLATGWDQGNSTLGRINRSLVLPFIGVFWIALVWPLTQKQFCLGDPSSGKLALTIYLLALHRRTDPFIMTRWRDFWILVIRLTRMPTGCLPGEVFQAFPTGRRPWGKTRIHQRD